MTRHDEVVDDNADLDPYSPAQLADLEDGQLLELKQNVEALIAERVERCRALMSAIAKKRGPRKSKTTKES